MSLSNSKSDTHGGVFVNSCIQQGQYGYSLFQICVLIELPQSSGEKVKLKPLHTYTQMFQNHHIYPQLYI